MNCCSINYVVGSLLYCWYIRCNHCGHMCITSRHSHQFGSDWHKCWYMCNKIGICGQHQWAMLVIYLLRRCCQQKYILIFIYIHNINKGHNLHKILLSVIKLQLNIIKHLKCLQCSHFFFFDVDLDFWKGWRFGLYYSRSCCSSVTLSHFSFSISHNNMIYLIIF